MLAHHSISLSDLSLLSMLTGSTPSTSASPSADSSSTHQQTNNSTRNSLKQRAKDRRPPVDPLLIAAAASSGPHVTRNHFAHAFQPQGKPLAYASCDDERLTSSSSAPGPNRPKMESCQAPRSVRLKVEEEEKRRKDLADRIREERTQAEKELQGKPAAVAMPTPGGGYEIQEDGKLEKELAKEAKVAKVAKKGKAPGTIPSAAPGVHTLKQEALLDLLRQPSTPPPLAHPLASPSFLTSAPSAVRAESPSLAAAIAAVPPPSTAAPPSTSSVPAGKEPLPPLEVQCRVRTRIPTPHGHIFLYLYTNNHDTKEHLAFVADHAQMASTSLTTNAVEGNAIVAETGEKRLLPFIRSKSLDAKWHEGETDEERILRGAYVGRLSATSQIASSANPHSLDPSSSSSSSSTAPHVHTSSPSTHRDGPTDPPLVRIHSECFTGETIGSQRCDCGEQLDEAFRLITLSGRGVVVYLRQEGRGIGLLEKMRAYNLQDLGHDTVTANLMLGHGADLRTYGVAGGILRDLGVAGGGVRLLTNNPDKIKQIEGEGVRVRERVGMVPRSWVEAELRGERERRRAKRRKAKAKAKQGNSIDSSINSLSASPSISTPHSPSRPSSTRASSPTSAPFSADSDSDSDSNSDTAASASVHSAASLSYHMRHAGVGMIGASTTASPELEKYLRTKIERMGHMLHVPGEGDGNAESHSRAG
ncbi:hypothetical protein JCM11641_000044 [Rhodosporidiobolus odoratus]